MRPRTFSLAPGQELVDKYVVLYREVKAAIRQSTYKPSHGQLLWLRRTDRLVDRLVNALNQLTQDQDIAGLSREAFATCQLHEAKLRKLVGSMEEARNVVVTYEKRSDPPPTPTSPDEAQNSGVV
ncbi:hypothetical protein EXIGLDRAFT_775746 [Exidia glandulosa HHB12029]|uniref:Uncharacterized protein n=1 Tax=Exidia glandulosa HHB12029 TaxID=1314781 RepID=A0A165DSE9_EXIGL|nr:hypothetical protein EXIGLDRAFT_775746 [Exidia glandulosa HHB12029]